MKLHYQQINQDSIKTTQGKCNTICSYFITIVCFLVGIFLASGFMYSSDNLVNKIVFTNQTAVYEKFHCNNHTINKNTTECNYVNLQMELLIMMGHGSIAFAINSIVLYYFSYTFIKITRFEETTGKRFLGNPYNRLVFFRNASIGFFIQGLVGQGLGNLYLYLRINTLIFNIIPYLAGQMFLTGIFIIMGICILFCGCVFIFI